MKKTNLLLVLILLLTLALSACQGSSAEEVTVEAAGTPEPGTERGLSESMQLLLGILSLADSDTPLTAEQATGMLPLWKAVRSLGKLAKHGHLTARERWELAVRLRRILGQDENFEWDRAYVVRKEAQEALGSVMSELRLLSAAAAIRRGEMPYLSITRS